MSTSPIKQIGIAVVEHAGRYLVGIRGSNVPLAGFSEFPGGKCLPDESPEACAVRECLEETGLAVTIERLLFRRVFTYPHASVDLHFFLCHPKDDASVRDDHQSYRWITAVDLSTLRFPEANAPLLAMLAD